MGYWLATGMEAWARAWSWQGRGREPASRSRSIWAQNGAEWHPTDMFPMPIASIMALTRPHALTPSRTPGITAFQRTAGDILTAKSDIRHQGMHGRSAEHAWRLWSPWCRRHRDGLRKQGVAGPARQRQWQVLATSSSAIISLRCCTTGTAGQSRMTMEWNGSIARLAGVLGPTWGAGLSSIRAHSFAAVGACVSGFLGLNPACLRVGAGSSRSIWLSCPFCATVFAP